MTEELRASKETKLKINIMHAVWPIYVYKVA